MDPSQILSTMNLVLWILLGAFVVLLVLFFLRGLARGWRYGLYRFISFAVFIAIGLSTLRVLANALGNWDLTNFNIGPYSRVISVNGTDTEISLVFGTPYSAISGAIQQLLEAYQVNGSPDTIAAYANSLGQSILMLLLISVEALLLMTVINLLIMIMWHIAWKRFIPKEKRKESYKQGKLWGAFSDLVIGIVCCCMFIYPLTSIVNTLAYSYSKANEETEGSLRADSTTADTIGQVVDAYENSAFAKVFFSWTRNQQGLTFDAALTNYLTVGNYGDATVSFINELSSLTKAYTVALQGGLLGQDSGSEGLSKTYFACSYYMPVLMESLSQSGLLNGLAPYAIEVASHISGIRKYLETDSGLPVSIDYSTTASLSKLAELYRSVLDSGLASNALDSDGNPVSNEELMRQCFASDTAAPMETLLKSFDSDDLKLFDTLIAAAAYCMSYNQSSESSSNPDSIGINDFVPKVTDYDSDGNGTPDQVPEAFLSFQWGHEVAVFYDCVVRLCAIDDNFFDVCFNSIINPGESVDTGAILKMIAKHADEVGKILYGDGTSSSTGKAYAEGEESTSDDTLLCFLDSRLLENGLGKILTILQDTLNSAFNLPDADKIDLSGAKTALLSDDFDTQVKAMKTEFASLFDIIKQLVSNDAGVNFLSDLTNKPGLYFDADNKFVGADDDLIDALAKSLNVMDSSKLASAFIPPIFEHYLGSNSALLPSAGLSLNFKGGHVGASLAQIVRTCGKCQEMITYVSGLSGSAASGTALKNELATLVGYSDELTDFLTMMVENPILNPEGSLNSNLYGIINMLIKATLGDYSDELKAAIENNGFSAADEMKTLVKILKDLQSSDILTKMENFTSTKNISALSSVDFTTLMSDVQDSDIIKSFLGTYLDSKMADSGLFESGDLSSSGISFTHVTDWSKEGTGIASIIKAASSIGDLANIDFLNSDPDSIATILSVLSQSPIFTNDNGDYLFSSYISKKLVSSISGNSSAGSFFSDKGTTSGSYTFDTMKANVSALSKADWLSESLTFGEVIYRSARLGSFNAFGSGDLRKINPLDVEGLLTSLNESRAFGNLVTYHIYETMNQSLVDAGSSAFENTNLDYLYNLDPTYSSDAAGVSLFEAAKSKRADANEKLVSLVHVLLDPSGVDSSGNLVYSLLDNSTGAMNTSNLTIENADANYVVKPLLKSLAESPVFNTLKSTAATSTAFEGELADVLVKSGLYGDKNSSTVASNVLGYVQSVAPDDVSTSSDEVTRFQNWDDEVEQICASVLSVKNLGITDFANFDFAGLFGGTSATATADEAVRLKVYSVLENINESKVLYHALPLQIDNAVSSASSSDFDLSGANSDYNSGAKYGTDELETLSYIFMESAAVKKIDSASLSGLSLDKFQIESISNMLASLDQSHIFNSLASGSTATKTVFQKNMASVLTKNSSLANVYYSANNPKDAYFAGLTSGGYSSASSKADYYVLKDLPAIKLTEDGTNYSTSMVNGDDHSLKAVLTAFANQSATLSALTGGDTSNLTDPTALENMLNALDQCDLLHDCVPNALSQFTGGGSSSFNYGSVNFSRANPYFAYWFKDTNADGVKDSMLPSSSQTTANATYASSSVLDDTYGVSEIHTLANLIVDLNSAQSTMNGVGTTAIATSDTTTLTKIRKVLVELNDSYVFHQGQEWGTPNTSTWAGDDLTVFEQVMFKLYSDIQLSDRAYLAYYDTAFASATAKLHSNLVSFSAGTLPTYQVTSGVTDGWEQEIDALVCSDSGTNDGIGLLEIAKEQGLLTSGANFSNSSSGVSFTSREPGTLQALLDGMNKVNVTQDAVPYSLGNFLNDSLDFKRYSEFSATTTITSVTTYPANLGLYESASIVSSSAPTLSYSYDGSAYTTLAATSTSGSTYTFDLGDLKPSYLRVTPSASSAVTLTADTSDYASLTQAQLKGDQGYIAAVTSFASSVYDPTSYGTSNGGYINFRNSDDITHYLTSGADLSGMLNVLSHKNGAYVQRYYQVSENSSYQLSVTFGSASSYNVLSRDLTFANILRMPYTYTLGGTSTTVTVDLAKYLASDDSNGSFESKLNPLLQAEAVFSSSDYHNQAEGNWLSGNLGNILKVEFIYNTSTVYPINTALESLCQLAAGTGLDSIVANAINPVGTTSVVSAFGQRYGAGLADELSNLAYAYLQSGNYQILSTSAPLDAMNNRTANLTPFVRPNFYSAYAFTDLNASLKEALSDYLDTAALVRYGLVSSNGKTLSAAQKSTVSEKFASLSTLYAGVSGATRASNLGSFIKSIYESSIYDWFVDRDYYTATNATNTSGNAWQHINSTDFSFANAANAIVAA